MMQESADGNDLPLNVPVDPDFLVPFRKTEHVATQMLPSDKVVKYATQTANRHSATNANLSQSQITEPLHESNRNSVQ